MRSAKSAVDDRTPVLVGAGQVTLRDQQWPDLAGPVDMMAEAVGAAVADAGGTALLARVDSLTVVNVFSWNHANAPALLADQLGLGPGERTYLGVGGNTPQEALNGLFRRLQAGEITVAVLAGAEAGAARKAAKKAGHRASWPISADPLPMQQPREPVAASEMRHMAILPIRTYPMFEPALRVAADRTPEAHAEHIGRLMAAFTEVAAKNPYAWFPQARTADDLMTVTPSNRMVCLPYPKGVNAVLDVDQGAAVIATTAGVARAAGIPQDRWVFPWAGSDCYDVWHITERVAYDHSPAIRSNYRRIRELSGVSVDDIGHFDLYSCFPSAVQLAVEAIGIGVGDDRPLTVTGGLPYFGGPGNNYVSHGVAAMVQRLRDEPGTLGLCTGVGWFVTKNSMGLYSTEPPPNPFATNDAAADTAAVQSLEHPVMVRDPEAGTEATIEGYTVVYGRSGSPEVAIALARVDDDHRAMVSSQDADLAVAMCEGEWHGRKVRFRDGASFEAV